MIYDVNKIGYDGGQYQAVMLGGKCLAITRNGEGEKYLTIPVESSNIYPNARIFISGFSTKNYVIPKGKTELCLPLPKEMTEQGTNYKIKRISFMQGSVLPDIIDFSNVNVTGDLSIVYRVRIGVILPKNLNGAIGINGEYIGNSAETLDLTPYTCYELKATDGTPVKIGTIGGRDIVVFETVRNIQEVNSINEAVEYLDLNYMNSDNIKKIVGAAGEQNRGKLNIRTTMREGEEIAADVYTMAEEKGIVLS